MSICIPFEELKSDGETKKLKKFLTLKSSTKEERLGRGGYRGRGRGGRGRDGRGYQEKVITVNMYYVRNGLLHIPFRFARAYFSQPSRVEKYGKYLKKKKYPELFPEGSKKDKFKGALRDYQAEAFEEARAQLKKERTTTLALYPGFGKTFLGSLFSWKYNLYTLVLVHRKNIAKAWITTFKAYLPDLGEDGLVMVDDKIGKPRKKGRGKKAKILPPLSETGKVFICMDARSEHIPDEVKEKIGLLIIDEAHLFCSPSKVTALLSITPKYVIAETATPEKSNGLETVIQSICGEHYIRRVSKKPFKMYIIQTDLDFPNTGNNPWLDLIDKQMNSEERNKIIVDIVERHPQFKTMIIANRVEHCKKLMEKIKEECSGLYGSIDKYKTQRVLVGTGGKMGVGFDEANACDDYDGEPSELLLLTHSYAQWSTWEQHRGRGMRSKYPKIVMFVDKNNITKNHIREAKKWAAECNGVVINVPLKDIWDFKIE